MKSKLVFPILAFFLAGAPVQAAPSTDLGDEFFLPLETSGSQFVLAEISFGRVRVLQAGSNGVVSEVSQYPTDFPGLTGVTSGSVSGGGEELFFANVTANRIGRTPVHGGGVTGISSLEPGPALPALTRPPGGGDLQLVCGTKYAASGFGLELIGGLQTFPETNDFWLDLPVISDVQPLYSSAAGTRFAAVVGVDGLGQTVLSIREDSGFQLSETHRGNLPADARIASCVKGDDGRLLVVSYVEGSASVTFHTVAPDGSVTAVHSDSAPQPVQSVSAIQMVGQTHGVSLTYQDGSSAALAEIVTGKTLNILETFDVSKDMQLLGLVPTGNGNLIRLEKIPGFYGAATHYVSHRKSGGVWNEVASGTLPGLPDLFSQERPTLFWYQGNPAVDEAAELVKIEWKAEWTRPDMGEAPIATKVFGEQFAGGASGLVAFDEGSSPLVPAGADFLVTNQFSEAASISALDAGASFRRPDFEVFPADGFFEEPIFVRASYDVDRETLYYREERDGSSWEVFESGLPVSYNSSYLFYTRDSVTGRRSPILRRNYYFASIPPDTDWDADGVPDFVEQYYFLNPGGGADSDGDGSSDLEEIVEGTDPADPNSKPANTNGGPGGVREAISNGDGFTLAVQPKGRTVGSVASAGVKVELRDATGALLRNELVDTLDAPPGLAGQRAALVRQDTAVGGDEWIVLNSPTRFRLGSGAGSSGGLEEYRLMPVPEEESPDLGLFLNGFDLEADAQAWIAAIRNHFQNHEFVSELTELSPFNNCGVVVAEAILHAELMQLPPELRSSLGVPDDVRDFTILGGRASDAERQRMTRAMMAELFSRGFDGKVFAGDLENSLSAPEFADVKSLGNRLQILFFSGVDAEPTIPFPIDAMRQLLHDGTLPAGYANQPLGFNPALTRTKMMEMVTGGARYRPVEVWTVTVYTGLNSINPGVDFFRPGFEKVHFLDALGEPFEFQQGLGINDNTVIVVRGYVDLPPKPPFDEPVMEVLELVSMMIPQGSGSDADGNLLEDDWEDYFFGATGQDAFGQVATGGQLIQYFLQGLDPRQDTLEPGEVLTFSLDGLELVPSLGEGNALEWEWPVEYLDYFDFEILTSSNLGEEAFLPQAVMAEPSGAGDGKVRLELPDDLFLPEKNFFILRVSLAD